MGTGQLTLRAEPGGGGRSPPSRPECSTRRRPRVCATTRGVAFVARGSSVRLHTTRAPGQSRSSSSSRKRCRHRHPHRRRRNSRRNRPRQQGKGGQEGVEQKVCGRTTCSLAGTTCQLAGAVGHGGTAAITDSTDSAVRQGRPRRGQGREKRGVSSQTPRDPWDFVMHTVPGSVSPTLFHGDNQLSRG